MTKHRKGITIQQIAGGRFGMVLLAGGVCCLLVGCGGDLYERGLKDTVAYYSHREKLDLNLKPLWPGPQKAPIKLRVPKQFELMAPPKPKPDPDEEGRMIPVPPEEDPRQPEYIPAVLPGLEAAWKTKPLEVVVGQEPMKVPAYLYVLSNHAMRRDREMAEYALNFHNDVMEVLTRTLKIEYPEEDEWEEPRYPAAEGYVEPKRFTSITLKPGQPINGAPADVMIYLYHVENIQVVVLFVIPQGHDSRQKLRERIALCLETLTVSSAKPGQFGPAKAKKPAF